MKQGMGIVSLMLLLMLFAPAGGSSELRPNIRIDVEFKSASRVAQNVAPYQIVRQEHQSQFLVVQDGLEGRLFIGEDIPYVTWYRDYLFKEGYLAREITFRHVGTSLIVRPQIIGNQIEISLTPEVSYQTKDGSGSIAVTKMSTTVRTTDGQPVKIGGAIKSSEFANNFYRRSSGEAVAVVLTPHVLE